MDSHCHDDVIQFLRIFLRIFLVARYRAVGIVTLVTCAPQSKCYLQTHVHSERALYEIITSRYTYLLLLPIYFT
jgi:hypothetical protein